MAVLALIAALYLPRVWPFSRERISQSLQEEFRGQVTFTGFRKTFFPHPGCIADGVTIARESKERGPLAFVNVQKLTVQAHYWDLLLRPGYVAHVKADGLQVRVPKRGTFEQAGAPEESKTRIGEALAENALLEIGRERGEPLKFEIHRMTLHMVGLATQMEYDVAFRNPVPPGEIQSRGYFGPWNGQNLGETPVSGTYQFTDADLSAFGGVSGTLQAHDSFTGKLREITTRGSVEVPEFKLRRAGRSVPLVTKFEARVNALNGDVHLDRLDNMIAKTRVLAHGEVAGKPGQKGKTTSLEFNVSNGRIQDVLRIFIKELSSPISGVTSFRARVVVPPEGKPFEEEVRLSGDFGIEKERFTRTNTRRDVEHLSERARGQEPLKDDDEEDPAGVTDLKGHVELKNGVATLTQITFGIPGGEANGHGTFNLLNDKIDFHGTLKTEAQFTKVAGGGVKSIFLKPFDAIFKKKPRGSEIPVKLTGTYAHPEPGLEITGGKKPHDE